MSTEPWRFSKRGELLPPACLNCQAVMIELFCAKCGQKNEVPNRALWPLLKDSIGLFLVADGKLWRTLHLLLFKPGELAVQYVAGRRAAYVKPFTMYFWVSALVLTSMLFDWSELSFGPPAEAKPSEFKPIQVDERELALFQKAASDEHTPALVKRYATTMAWYQSSPRTAKPLIDGWVLSKLPRAAFFLVPIFALMMKLLFSHRRYTEHLVLTLHAQTVFFLLFGLADAVPDALSLTLGGAIFASFALWLPLAVRRFYAVTWRRTVLSLLAGAVLGGVIIIATGVVLYVLAFVVIRAPV